MALSQESHPFIIRIVLPNGAATDWRVDSAISFHDVLDVLKRVMPESTPTAFEYEDEEGDRITVRTDDELVAMVIWHQWINSQRIVNGISQYPLLIYPRVSRTSTSRNVLGLTLLRQACIVPFTYYTPEVNLGASPRDCQAKENNVNSAGSSGSSGRKQSDPEDIKTIISSGQITQNDLHYLQIMGHGNGGTVYKSLHTPSQKILAVKVIPLDITYDVQKQIMSELEILFQCHSSQIIAFYGAFFLENKISICTEFMDGGSLDNFGTIPELVLGSIAVSVLKGLEYLWNKKIMHRDVKPSNMLVNTNGEVKLCDFGVSIQLVNSIAKTYVGTNAYMAPERILGDEYGIHSDVWSLGLSLIEMARGKFPYPQDGSTKVEGLLPIELLHCIVNEVPPGLPPNLFSAELVDFVSKCLQKAPKLRPTPDQLLEHPYIKVHDHGNLSVVAAFVTKRLEEVKDQPMTS